MLINVSKHKGVWQWKLYSKVTAGPCLARSGVFYKDAYSANKAAVKFRNKLVSLGISVRLSRAVYDVPVKVCRKNITLQEVKRVRAMQYNTPYGYSVIKRQRIP